MVDPVVTVSNSLRNHQQLAVVDPSIGHVSQPPGLQPVVQIVLEECPHGCSRFGGVRLDRTTIARIEKPKASKRYRMKSSVSI